MAAVPSDLESKVAEAFLDDDFELETQANHGLLLHRNPLHTTSREIKMDVVTGLYGSQARWMSSAERIWQFRWRLSGLTTPDLRPMAPVASAGSVSTSSAIEALPPAEEEHGDEFIAVETPGRLLGPAFTAPPRHINSSSAHQLHRLSIAEIMRQIRKSGKGLEETLAVIKHGRVPLHMAAWAGRLEMCKYLVDELRLDTNAPRFDGNVPCPVRH